VATVVASSLVHLEWNQGLNCWGHSPFYSIIAYFNLCILICGFIAGALTAFLYNVVASLIGGIEIKLEQK